MSSKPSLNDLFLAMHDRLACELGITRRTIGHTGTKGAVSESQWIEVLRNYLPKRYKVNRAFVIDSKGACSDQVDIVIHDRQYSPFVLNYDDALYVPAESVYAAFEVKQTMNADIVKYAAGKVASVRALHRTSTPFYSNRGAEAPKLLHEVIGGLLVTDSDWNPPLGSAFKSALMAAPKAGRLQIGCAAVHGMFEVTYSDTGSSDIDARSSSASLALFMLRLIHSLRSIATVPAIDTLAYAESGILSTRV